MDAFLVAVFVIALFAAPIIFLAPRIPYEERLTVKKDCNNCGNRCMEPMDMNPYCAAVNKPWGASLTRAKPKECGEESKLWVPDTRGKI